MKIDSITKAKLKSQLVRSLTEEKKNTVTITTPFELSQTQVEYFRNELKLPADAKLELNVDREIIGGFIIQNGSMVIDASVVTRINNLLHQLVQTI